ncbi:peptidase [archaeon]|jgi:protease I|nr:peptidase [archaeon]
MTKRALIITGNLVQDHEYIYPYYRLLEEGFEMIVALKDGASCEGILGTKIPSDDRCRVISYEELSNFGDDADIMVLPGGAKAMEKLRQEPIVLNYIRDWDIQGKIIASICHGAQLLISAKIVQGRNISAYYSIKDDVNNAGANYVDAGFVTDRNIVSSPHYKYLGDWMKEVLRLFEVQQKNDKENSNF